jgi:hypothetical protein
LNHFTQPVRGVEEEVEEAIFITLRNIAILIGLPSMIDIGGIFLSWFFWH